MSKVLRLQNTFTKSLDDVKIAGRLVTTQYEVREPHTGSLYICGPTVYSDSHIGHALTYIRADLFRRFMKSIFNMKLITVMNITDIDDKILEIARKEKLLGDVNNSSPADHPFNEISRKYYRSFQEDMEALRIQPPDLTVHVSRHVGPIAKYIGVLEKKGHTYTAKNGDVYFDTNSIKSYIGRTRTDEPKAPPDGHKKDPRDFVLWKATKPGEPVWIYHSEVSGQDIPGRPGWHVQCSAIASSVFGHSLDFHFGGRDLVFPHHYNEEACCCAYHNLVTSDSLHVWSKHWLHSGHLVLKDHKMSKSLGNVIAIKRMIEDSSVNALRLLCITNHYRANIEFDSKLVERLQALDHRLSAFINHLSSALKSTCAESQSNNLSDDVDLSLEDILEQTNNDIVEGVCDEFDLDRGLSSILELTKVIYNRGVDNISLRDLISTWQLTKDWCETCGLEFGPMKSSQDGMIVQFVREFRQNVRISAISGLKQAKMDTANGSVAEATLRLENFNQILKECDKVREKLDALGFVERDEGIKKVIHTKPSGKN